MAKAKVPQPEASTDKSFMHWKDEDLSVMKLFDLIDLDKLFMNSPGARIVNNETLVSQNLSKDFTSAIYQNSDGEIGFVPTCKCGNIKGVTKVGMTCPQCQSICSSEFIDVLTHTAWLGIPDTMAPVLHPVWYMVLKNWATVGRRDISVIDIILNPEEDIPDDLLPFIKGRGFWYFYENANEILDMLINEYPRTAKKASTEWIKCFRQVYEDRMFTRHLPILHNSLHPLKKNGSTLNYVDNTSKEILEAIINLSSETFKQHATTPNPRQQNRALYGIYDKVMSYYKGLIKDKLGGKQAILRKHCFGSRVQCSFRTVIVPHEMPTPLDEVILPWGIIVNGMKEPILNLLMNRYHETFNQALERFTKSLVVYDPKIDECLRTLRDESPDGKFAFIMGRNPS